MTFDETVLFLTCSLAMFAAFWQSPRALMWVIAKMCARIDAIKVQRASFAKYLTELEER